MNISFRPKNRLFDSNFVRQGGGMVIWRNQRLFDFVRT